MALAKNNIVTEGFSGMLANRIVFRSFNGKTVVANRPRKPTRQSELQRANRSRFRDATAFAHGAMLDPQKKAFYWEKARKLKLPNAYTAAITDYMRRPIVARVETPKHNGVDARLMIASPPWMLQATSAVSIMAIHLGAFTPSSSRSQLSALPVPRCSD